MLRQRQAPKVRLLDHGALRHPLFHTSAGKLVHFGLDLFKRLGHKEAHYSADEWVFEQDRGDGQVLESVEDGFDPPVVLAPLEQAQALSKRKVANDVEREAIQELDGIDRGVRGFAGLADDDADELVDVLLDQ